MLYGGTVYEIALDNRYRTVVEVSEDTEYCSGCFPDQWKRLLILSVFCFRFAHVPTCMLYWFKRRNTTSKMKGSEKGMNIYRDNNTGRCVTLAQVRPMLVSGVRHEAQETLTGQVYTVPDSQVGSPRFTLLGHR